MASIQTDGLAQGHPAAVQHDADIAGARRPDRRGWKLAARFALLAGLMTPPWAASGAVASIEPQAKVVDGRQETATSIVARNPRVAEADKAEMTFETNRNTYISPLTSPQVAREISHYEQIVRANPSNASAWNNLGHLRLRTGDLQGAKRAYHAVLKLGLYHGSREVQAGAYANLGIVYKSIGDLERAQLAHKKALTLSTRIGRRDRMADAYINLGVIHQAKGNYEEAIEAQQRALNINRQLGNREGMANAYGNLGVVYRLTGDLLKAETSLTKSLAMKEHLGDREGVAKAHANLGSIYRSRGNRREACRLWSRAQSEFGAVNHQQWENTVRAWMAETKCGR